MRTAFVSKRDGGVLVRWMHAEDENGVRRAVETIPEAVWEATPHWIEVGQEGIFVFDSAFPGDALPSLRTIRSTCPGFASSCRPAPTWSIRPITSPMTQLD
jgi:hypothetical protein